MAILNQIDTHEVAAMPAHPLPVTIDDIHSAAAAIAGSVVRTPLSRSATLSSITGAEVWIKYENLQYTASFKERGARNRLLALTDDERRGGVVAMSAGNHAQGVARHATLLGIASTVVMPQNTPVTKVTRTEQDGATVILAGATLDEAALVAAELAAAKNLTFIAPYDDPLIIAGQGTCALEMLSDGPEFDVLIVPVGGGGLFAGTCVAAQAISPDTELIGVQSALFSSMVRAVTDHDVVDDLSSWGPTIAEGIAVKSPGVLTSSIIKALATDVVAVSERFIEEAIVHLLEIEKVVAEGAGAAALAALLAEPDRFAGRTVGLVLSGGNIDLRLLSAVIMRGLAQTGRLCRLLIDVPDAPGALGALTAEIGRAGANIVDLSHHREFGIRSARVTEVDVLTETRDRVAADELRHRLKELGYAVMNTRDGL